MAAASDKARFFLERSVPELREYERKKIFSPEEITSIAKRRSAFEHKINARGPTASDFARYAEFEMNVEALRRKRVKRLSVKTTNHNGQRRVFFVFDRGTKKHPGDIDLWMQSIEYARAQKATKKLAQIFTNVLRLHPSRAELWIFAAQSALEDNGDMTEARGYMQRGVRFCKNEKDIWLQYARLELAYSAKLHARRQILGIPVDSTGSREIHTVEPAADIDAPGFSAAVAGGDEEDNLPGTQEVSAADRGSVSSLALPITIFEAAMEQFEGDPSLTSTFVDILAEYAYLPGSRAFLQHIIDFLEDRQQSHWAKDACSICEPVFGLDVSAIEYPKALRESLRRLKIAQSANPASEIAGLTKWARKWLKSMLNEDDLYPSIKLVLESTLQRLSSEDSVG